MALRPLSSAPFSAFSKTHLSDFFLLRSNSRYPHMPWRLHLKSVAVSSASFSVRGCVKLEEKDTSDNNKSNSSDAAGDWGKVSAVLFDMDGVLCNSEVPSRMAAVDVFAEMGVEVTTEDFAPFTGTGEAKFLGGVASAKGLKGFNVDAAKKRFFEIYLTKYAKPNSGIGFPGAYEIINQCKSRGLKVAVASSADLVKVKANLGAAGLPLSMFDAIVSADAFENLKPAPDIFLAASNILNVPPNECVVIEDALVGVLAAKAAGMRCVAVTTSLSEEIIKGSGPTLIRKDISGISLDDILYGGSSSPNVKKTQGPELTEASMQTADVFSMLYGVDNRSLEDRVSTQDAASSLGGLLGSRRNLLRYGSLAVAVSCLFYTITNLKAMQYASPKAIWNQLFGVDSPPFEQNEDESRSSRIKQFMKYISDLEARGSATTVPEFPPKLDWLNSAPLQLSRDLKGKVVLLDFWTYCCINCMHVLPDLEYLEKKYKDMPFVVVGVHSAKFDNEKDIEAIRNAVLRYNITHPVVNDGEMNLWRELGINSWPTFVLISPNGKLIAQLAGEGHRKDLDDLIEAALLYYNTKKAFNNKPIPLRLEKNNDPRYLMSPLKYPGKLAIDVLNNRLFISDSNHNRIVVTDLDGNFIIQIGSSGEEGFRDGNFDETRFNRPQGLAYNAKKNVLYVADTENHALRIIDFVQDTVGTLAGNGKKGSDYQGGRIGNDQLLNSPWDVCFDSGNEIVYIAMAGQHQIWKHDTHSGVTSAFSGDGYERNLNGTSSTSTSFAQPSGISLSPGLTEAYIADSESSSIRALNLKTGGSRLLAGGDPVFSDNLFKFGDQDGVGSEVLLQHPLGVFCGKDGQLYVADSYNHKIKKVDPLSRRVSTLAGTGEAGFRDGTALSAQLSEPSGIVEAEGRLYIADTNNNLIRYLDLNVEKAELHTLELKGVQPPVPKLRSFKRLQRRSAADNEVVVANGVTSPEGDLTLKISVPDGYHFSKEAISKYDVEIEPENNLVIDPMEGNLNPDASTVLHFRKSSPSSSIGRIHCKVYYCKEDEVCLYQSLTFEVHFEEEEKEAEVGPVSNSANIMLQYVVRPKAKRSGSVTLN